MNLDILTKKELMLIVEEVVKIYPDIYRIVEQFQTKKSSSTAQSHMSSSSSSSNSSSLEGMSKNKSGGRMFDMSKYRQRHIALQVQYEGGAYFGFAAQAEGRGDPCEETIEKHLFAAFNKLRLIQDRASCGYSRAGRTDRGVSALGQVIALKLRSAFPKDDENEEKASSGQEKSRPLLLPAHPNDTLLLATPKNVPERSSEGEPVEKKQKLNSNESSTSTVCEIDYATLLNRNLPSGIRILGWTEVSEKFSSRFSASSRTYRYFFLKRKLNIDAMKEAANQLLGVHDFRNLSKLDVANVSNFEREILSIDIRPVVPPYECKGDSCSGDHWPHSEEKEEHDLYVFEVTGVAFLWHMVRCIMAVLFLVGEEREKPSIIRSLLDIESLPSKPQYDMAPETPLVLHACGYERLHIHYQPTVLWALTKHYGAQLEECLLQAARIRNSLQFLYSAKIRGKDMKELIRQLGVQESFSRGSERKGDEEEDMDWGRALSWLGQYKIFPHNYTKAKYIPLLQVINSLFIVI